MAEIKTYPKTPYFDDYEEARSKDYVQILARCGEYAQSREFTQMGTMMRDFLGRLGDSVFRNGQIISGCSISIEDNIAKIDKGTVYLEGLVREIRESVTVGITGMGTEYVGVYVEEKEILDTEDPSLLNPAVGTEGYGQPGAARVQQVVKLKSSTDITELVPLYQIVDGKVYTEVSGGGSDDSLMKILAQRTYDVSGNFKVEGLELSKVKAREKETKPKVNINAGKAYVKGNRLVLQSMIEQSLDPAIDTGDVKSNYVAFPRRIESGEYYRWPLSKTVYHPKDKENPNYFEEGNFEIQVDLRQEEEAAQVESLLFVSLKRGEGDGRTAGSLIKVFNVWKDKEHTQPYEEGDWEVLTVEGERKLHMRTGSSGTTVHVSYQYSTTLKEDTKYKLDPKLADRSQGGQYFVFKDTRNSGKWYVHIYPLGETTAPGTYIAEGDDARQTYKYYLSRSDTICLTQDGSIKVLRGIPDDPDKCLSPVNRDENSITLGTVLIYGNSANTLITNERSHVLTQAEIHKMKKRIEDLEYNQAIKDLDTEAATGEDATLLKGIYTDGFIGFSKADISHDDFDCAMDPERGEMTVQAPCTVVSLNPKTSGAKEIGGRIIVSPYDDVVCLDQSKATSAFPVNPYMVYGAEGVVTCSPSSDNWIEDEQIELTENPNYETKTYTLRRWWKHKNAKWAEEERLKWIALTGSTGEDLNWSDYDYQSVSTNTSYDLIDIAYMRQQTLKITGAGYQPGEQTTLYFKGEPYGTDHNYADSNGKVEYTMSIPPNTPCGTVAIEIRGSQTSGSTTYTAKGQIARTTVTTVLGNRTIVKTEDPLAQTFQFDEDTILSGIGLYFASKDPGTKVVSVQIRDVVNGYPGTTEYLRQVVLPESINANSSELVETRIMFNEPVYCEAGKQYCFAILTNSSAYNVWVANMGEKLVDTGKVISTQPYTDGVMFSSSNAITWTAHQTSDIAFKLYKCKFNGKKGVIEFDPISGNDCDRLMLLADIEDHRNSGVDWYYKVGSDWRSLDTYNDQEIGANVKSNFQLKAEIRVPESTSPILARDRMDLVLFTNKTRASYVSRSITMSEPYTHVQTYIQFSTNSGSEVERKVYFKYKADQDWIPMVLDTDSVVAVDSEFTQYRYTTDPETERDLEEEHATYFKVRVVMDNKGNAYVRPRARKLMNIIGVQE